MKKSVAVILFLGVLLITTACATPFTIRVEPSGNMTITSEPTPTPSIVPASVTPPAPTVTPTLPSTTITVTPPPIPTSLPTPTPTIHYGGTVTIGPITTLTPTPTPGGGLSITISPVTPTPTPASASTPAPTPMVGGSGGGGGGGVPLPPAVFYGSILINGSPAPIGTTVEARGTGVRTDISGNPITTTQAGNYGSTDPLVAKLIVQGNIVDGTTMSFYVNGVAANQTAPWHSGQITQLNLTVSAGGGGGTSNSPPITIALDYFGIKDTHWVSQVGGDPRAKIQLAVLIRDDQHVLKAISIPPESIPAYDVDFFQVIALKDNMSPEIFTGSATGSLTILVAAYNVNKGPITKAQMDILGQWLGTPEVGFLKSSVPDKEVVGFYWHTWSPSENWGIGGNYQGDINKDNFIPWIRIGSGQMPTPIPKPVLTPNVRIQNLSLPSDAKTSSGPYVFTVYSTTFRLMNNELVDVTVNWQANSSVTGNFDGGPVTVPKNNYRDVTKAYHYTSPGPVTVTYTIYCNGAQIDTKSGTMNVAP